MKNSLPIYLIDILKKYPNILSGRKNFKKHHIRIVKNISLTLKYKLSKKINNRNN